jgi:hypothetical protein
LGILYISSLGNGEGSKGSKRRVRLVQSGPHHHLIEN